MSRSTTTRSTARSPPQHYAFLIGEHEFDEIFDRIGERGLDYWADPMLQPPRRDQPQRRRSRRVLPRSRRPPARDHHPPLRERWLRARCLRSGDAGQRRSRPAVPRRRRPRRVRPACAGACCGRCRRGSTSSARPTRRERRNGMTLNWATQVSFDPKWLGIGVEQEAFTHELIAAGGVFSLCIDRPRGPRDRPEVHQAGRGRPRRAAR